MTGRDPQRSEARLRVMAARVIAQQRWPYASNLLFNFKFVEVPHEALPTMGVDKGWRLYYSPEFVMGETPEALATVLLHECLHCLHEHGERFDAVKRPASDHPVWNFAGDAAINEVLDEAQMPWPSVTPVRYTDLVRYGVTPGMTTEAAFFSICDYRDEHGLDNPDLTDCGSVSGGAIRSYELPADDQVSPGMRSDQQDIIRDRVAHDVIERNRTAGDVPAGLLRWAQSLMNPRVGWREALASRMRRELASVAGRRDYVYTRPSRRQEAMRLAGSPAILPAMRQPAPPRVACIIDTSGSISEAELRGFLSEVVGIARASGVAGGVTVIACDSQAYEPQRVKSASDVEFLRLEGGGGTDMSVGLALVAELRPIPHIVVVFTDGYTPWPANQPSGVDSVIIALADSTSRADIPRWAQVIPLE